ncbi:MAG: hypothetical protein COU31_04060 [Candidatus Magasanikbacteria bacterium CG10_big_fil_rev_8_21_14_0_10_40_10]|uniref:Uncharacterized protein n=1 Tax=Candidatus Magasanikbacteria bacterium CG10_big_fil_rev_8_21_14_0_10_40_10 TaxID=1974648 RepID=A0A2M6W365_9BACT|nr:MAG: hypothetical protein COU31_04060 [Candidatus Magasanikbacteria bacterium CG10_big_fil_rev_8_21_14_0_10_40_10]
MFFISLGVLFFLLIIAGVYLYVADPYEIKPLIHLLTNQPTASTTATASVGKNEVDKNSLLSPAQEEALEKIGIDPAVLPTEITPAMEKCFYEKLGATRANEIKNGSEPTASDYFTARACL